MGLNSSRSILISVLIIITVLSLSFGLWGAYQIGRINGLNEEVHKSSSILIPNFIHESGKSLVLPFPHHDWFWGIGRMLCLFFFILCFFGFISRLFCGFDFWRWRCTDYWRHRHQWWENNCCQDYRKKEPDNS